MIPKLLLREKRWICHKDKVPRHPLTGAIGKKGENLQSNPEMWATYTDALKTCAEHDLTGIGFCLGGGFVGIDLDKCLKDGQLSDFANRIIERFDSFTEVSMSGNGIHIYIQATLKDAVKKEGIEIYAEGRYFAFTGKGKQQVKDGQAELDKLLLELRPPEPVEQSSARKDWRQIYLGTGKDEGRNNVVLSWGRALLARRWTIEEGRREIRSANADHKFPLDAAELEATIRSAFSKDGLELLFRPQQVLDNTEVPCILEPYLPADIVVYAGDGGSGKSFSTLALAVALSKGEWREKKFDPIRTLLFSQEDSEQIIGRRLQESLGAPADSVFVNIQTLSWPDMRTEDVSAAIEKYKTRLIVFDALNSYVGGKSDTYRDNEVVSILQPLRELTVRHKVCILIIAHLNKKTDQNANQRIAGSAALRNYPRSVLLAATNPEDHEQHAIVHNKHNTTYKGKTVGFEIRRGVEEGSGPSFRWVDTELTEADVSPAIKKVRAGKTAGDFVEGLMEGLSEYPTKDVLRIGLAADHAPGTLKAAWQERGFCSEPMDGKSGPGAIYMLKRKEGGI